jgi:hypothetical protein
MQFHVTVVLLWAFRHIQLFQLLINAQNGNLEAPVYFLKVKQRYAVWKTEKLKWL